jgi:hypothetical protein
MSTDRMRTDRSGMTAGVATPARPPVPRPGARPSAASVRSTAMLLLNEELARARTRELEAEAARARLVVRVRAARRWQRRAESAARRARLAAAAIV